MNDPAIFQQRAADLSNLRAQLELREEAERKKALDSEQRKILAWDAAMTRTFKGIVPRSTRVIFMRAAVKAGER